MPDPKQIPSLVKLLDDDSPFVREKVLEELHAFGPLLGNELAQLGLSLSADQERIISGVLQHHNRTWLRDAWSGLFSIGGDKQQLEEALNLLAQFLLGRRDHHRLGILLTDLAQEFRKRHGNGDALDLAAFLFQAKGLRGNHEDYYSPQNSNLVYVIEEKRGIPISLSCVYILVGHRLEFDVEGCNVPGHFLATARAQGQNVIVDCFNGGHLLMEGDLTRLNNTVPITMDDIAGLACGARTIIARVLRNLINAYHLLGDQENKTCMAGLLNTLEGVEKGSPG